VPLVTVSFSYKTTQGAAATGLVRFRKLNMPAATATTVALFRGGNNVALSAPATGSVVYVVTEQIDNVSRQTYEITVASSPSTQKLAVLRPTT
jgi:hypothetical protein